MQQCLVFHCIPGTTVINHRVKQNAEVWELQPSYNWRGCWWGRGALPVNFTVLFTTALKKHLEGKFSWHPWKPSLCVGGGKKKNLSKEKSAQNSKSMGQWKLVCYSVGSRFAGGKKSRRAYAENCSVWKWLSYMFDISDTIVRVAKTKLSVETLAIHDHMISCKLHRITKLPLFGLWCLAFLRVNSGWEERFQDSHAREMANVFRYLLHSWHSTELTSPFRP